MVSFLDEVVKDSEVPVFDWKRPHGIVNGLPGVRYSQDGHHFNGRQEYVPPENLKPMERKTAAEKQLEREAEKEALKCAFRAEVEAGTARQTIEAPVERDLIPENSILNAVPSQVDGDLQEMLDEIDAMHWTKLRKEVEANGGDYTGKPEAVRFLKAKTLEIYNG